MDTSATLSPQYDEVGRGFSLCVRDSAILDSAIDLHFACEILQIRPKNNFPNCSRKFNLPTAGRLYLVFCLLAFLEKSRFFPPRHRLKFHCALSLARWRPSKRRFCHF